MKNQIFYSKVLIIFICIGLCSAGSKAQDNAKKSTFGPSAVGISLGWYNPSLDYWQENSMFKDASFNGAISVNGFYDFEIIKDLHGQIGLGYWQSTAEEELQGYVGITKLLITGVPVSLDVLYQIEPIRFSIITPYVGLGGEYTFIQNKITFEQLDNPDPKSGSTFLGDGIIGLEAKLSENFAMDLEFRYKFGSYTQEFKNEIFDPEHPDDPPTIETIEEKISLNGPFAGITFKYLF
jgi:hypothetical protein